MTDDDTARLRALATSANPGALIRGVTRGQVLRLLDALDEARRERDEARAHLSAVLRHPARIRTGVMAAGYVGGACEHSPGERAKVTLFYEGAETAEAAFEHITEAIDALGEGHDGRDGGA